MLAGHRQLVQEVAGTSTLFASLDIGSVTLLIIAIHAAFIGGIFSILARIQDFSSNPNLTPLDIYISIVGKPFLAAIVVVLVFSVLRAGLVSFHGVDLAGPAAPYVAWVVGFLCGFSERFAQDFVVSAGSKLGEPSPPPTGSPIPS
jgi:hypothetical protein